jgi:predicted ATPase
MWLGVATMCRGAAFARLGHYEEGLAELHAGFSGFQGTGARFFNPLFVGFTAETHAAAGQMDAALATLDRADDVKAGPVESFYEAELLRLRGTLLIEKGDLAGAAACLRRALDLAGTQGAKSLELRAATNLAQLWCGRGKQIDALALLAPVHGWFTEGFDTPDLREAQALLSTLTSCALPA